MTKANGSAQPTSIFSFLSPSTLHSRRTKLRITLGCLLLTCCLAMTMTATAAMLPVPYIDSTWPISATPGGAGFLLTLWRTEFVSGAVVNWTVGCTTTPLHTIFISSIEVQVQVPSSLIATAGTATLTVVNPAPIPSSNPVFFAISNRSRRPSARRTILSASFPLSSTGPLASAILITTAYWTSPSETPVLTLFPS